jgi:hypothetical protein
VGGGERAIVTGVHGLQHVERLAAAALADDDAIRPHAQRVANQVADRDLAFAFHVRRPRLERHHVRLRQLQLRGVFDRDDALVLGDRGRQHVEQRGLAAARAAGDHDVLLGAHAAHEEAAHRVAQRAVRDQRLQIERLGRELADRDARAAQRDRPDHHVHARAVGQARVDQRRGFVDAPAKRGDDALDHRAHALVVGELTRAALHAAAALDVDVLRVEHHDLAHARVGQQRFERAEAERFVGHLSDQLRFGEAGGQAIRECLHDAAQRGEHARTERRIFGAAGLDRRHVELLEQPAMHLAP